MLSKLLATLILCTAAYAEPLVAGKQMLIAWDESKVDLLDFGNGGVNSSLRIVGFDPDVPFNVGDIIEVELWLSGPNVKIVGGTWIILYSEGLVLLGYDTTGAQTWANQSFIDDSGRDWLNFPCLLFDFDCLPASDGDALFNVFAGIAPTVPFGDPYPAQGLLATTFLFEVTAPGPHTIKIPDTYGESSETVIGDVFNNPVDGRKRGAHLRARA